MRKEKKGIEKKKIKKRESYKLIHTDKQTDTQTDRQTGRQTGRRTDR